MCLFHCAGATPRSQKRSLSEDWLVRPTAPAGEARCLGPQRSIKDTSLQEMAQARDLDAAAAEGVAYWLGKVYISIYIYIITVKRKDLDAPVSVDVTVCKEP